MGRMTNRPESVRRSVSLAIASLLVLVALAGCRGDDLSRLPDEARRERIEAMYREYKKDFPDTPDVTVEEFLAMRAAGNVVVVDGRDAEEREVSIIPGAIPLEQLERDLDRYRDRRIVLYCTIGYRSGLQAKSLRERGLNAFNLRGSILAWVHAGQPVVHAGGETKRLHVYGPEWNLAPHGYEAVW